MSTLAKVPQQDAGTLSLWKTPEIVLDEARVAANALMTVIKGKKDPVKFGGEQYIEREDWGTVAAFFKCSARMVEGSVNYVTYGDAYGFEATCECVDREDRVLSRATSMCLSDEDNWGKVPVYEDELDENGKKLFIKIDNPKPGGPKGYYKKKMVGEKPKPLFQLRSMAQTRAEAKCLKSVFGYVVVLAGYKATVAEEMMANQQPDDQEQPKNQQAPAPPAVQRKSQQQAQGQQPEKAEGNATPIQTFPGCITEKQIKFLFVMEKKCQISEVVLKTLIKQIAGVEHRNQIPQGEKFDALLTAMDPEFIHHTKKDSAPPPQEQ